MTQQSIDPESAVLFQQAADFYDRGEFDKAVIMLSALLSDHPQYVPALLRRGMILAEMETYERALEDFEAVIRLEPENGLAYFGRGWVRGNTGDPQGEIDDARHGLSIDPTNEPMYYRRIGHGLSALGRFQEAIKAYDHALELAPNQLGTLYNRALCFVELGQFEKAIAEFDAILVRNPQWSWALAARGRVHGKLEKVFAALGDFAMALRFDPTFVATYLDRGDLYEKHGEISRAIADYESAIRLAANP